MKLFCCNVLKCYCDREVCTGALRGQRIKIYDPGLFNPVSDGHLGFEEYKSSQLLTMTGSGYRT